MVKLIKSANINESQKEEIKKEKLRLRHAIQEMHIKNPKMSDKEIAEILKATKKYVVLWKDRVSKENAKKPNRKTKKTRKIKKFLVRLAKNKFTGIENASSRKIAKKINKKFGIQISHATANTWLNDEVGKPKKATTTFLIKKKNKQRRMDFAKMILEKKITGDQIFFTDEKKFLLHTPLNKQTNQMRLDEEGQKQLKEQKGEIFEKIAKPMPKFSSGVMVAGGLCSKGVGKLNFITGTMTSFSYLQTLKNYKDDINTLNKNLYFQQDGAGCHTSKQCLDYINNNFKNKLEFWPADSPDLSPIEEIWSFVSHQLYRRDYN